MCTLHKVELITVKSHTVCVFCHAHYHWIDPANQRTTYINVIRVNLYCERVTQACVWWDDSMVMVDALSAPTRATRVKASGSFCSPVLISRLRVLSTDNWPNQPCTFVPVMETIYQHRLTFRSPPLYAFYTWWLWLHTHTHTCLIIGLLMGHEAEKRVPIDSVGGGLGTAVWEWLTECVCVRAKRD